jgi:hypothetical protein
MRFVAACTKEEEEEAKMALQVVQLLAHDREVPGQVRTAIAEGRLEQAGLLLMDAFGLTCEEAGELVSRPLCEDCCD